MLIYIFSALCLNLDIGRGFLCSATIKREIEWVGEFVSLWAGFNLIRQAWDDAYKYIWLTRFKSLKSNLWWRYSWSCIKKWLIRFYRFLSALMTSYFSSSLPYSSLCLIASFRALIFCFYCFCFPFWFLIWIFYFSNFSFTSSSKQNCLSRGGAVSMNLPDIYKAKIFPIN